jgi:WD40 repeat protein
VLFDADGHRLISGGHGEQLVVCDVAGGKRLQTFPWDQRIRRILLLPDGRVVTGGEDGGVRIWDLDDTARSVDLPPHDKLVMALAVSPDGKRLVTGAYSDTIRLWDLEEGREIQRSDAHCGGAAFIDGGKQVVHLDGHQVVIRDADSFEIVRTLAEVGTHRHLLELAVSDDGMYAAFGDIEIFIHDLMTGKEVARIPAGGTTMLRGLAFVPGRHTLIAGDDSPQIRLVDAASGTVLHTHKLNSHSAMCLAVSLDGSTLASGGGTWKTGTGQYRDDPEKAIYLWRLPENVRP